MYVRSPAKYLVIVLFFSTPFIKAQVIDNSSAFKTINSASYFRFQYDNDFFTKEDRYYSQGIAFEYVHPNLKKNPFSKLLLKIPNSKMLHGIAFNVVGYTPTTILSENILRGDRPYAAIMSIKSFGTASDSINKKRVSSAFSIGVIGPAAFGKEIQVNIHRWLNNPLPKGWDTQIQNDIILNYQVNYEKQLFALPHHFLLNGAGELRLGTLDDRVGLGFNFMAGNFRNAYRALSYIRKPEIYFYGQAMAHVVGYNASLQGGLLNHNSPYVISLNQMERIIFKADAGIVVNFKKLFLAYSQSFLTKEFETGKMHRWGGFSIGYTW